MLDCDAWGQHLQPHRTNASPGKSRTKRYRGSRGNVQLPMPKRAAGCSKRSARPHTSTWAWSAVRELTRVAVRENEREWLQLARGKTVRQLEEVIAGKHLGDTPDSPSDPSARRHVLRFEVCAETFGLFRDALDELQRRTGTGTDDDSALLEMARHVLGGRATKAEPATKSRFTCVRTAATVGNNPKVSSYRSTPTYSGWPTVMPSTWGRSRSLQCNLPTIFRTRANTSAPTWAREPARASPQRDAAPSWCATNIAAKFPAVGTPGLSTSITWSCAPKAGAIRSSHPSPLASSAR
jgi:hypothetical protein